MYFSFYMDRHVNIPVERHKILKRATLSNAYGYDVEGTG